MLENERAIKDKQLLELGKAKEEMTLQLDATTKQLQSESVKTMKGLISER